MVLINVQVIADSIVEMGHGGKITHDCKNVIARRPFANETDGAVLNIITANPFEAGLL